MPAERRVGEPSTVTVAVAVPFLPIPRISDKDVYQHQMLVEHLTGELITVRLPVAVSLLLILSISEEPAVLLTFADQQIGEPSTVTVAVVLAPPLFHPDMGTPALLRQMHVDGLLQEHWTALSLVPLELLHFQSGMETHAMDLRMPAA